jgi:hypothetical protein
MYGGETRSSVLAKMRSTAAWQLVGVAAVPPINAAADLFGTGNRPVSSAQDRTTHRHQSKPEQALAEAKKALVVKIQMVCASMLGKRQSVAATNKRALHGVSAVMTCLPAAGGVDGVPSSGMLRVKEFQSAFFPIHIAWSRERGVALAESFDDADWQALPMNASRSVLHPPMVRSI